MLLASDKPGRLEPMFHMRAWFHAPSSFVTFFEVVEGSLQSMEMPIKLLRSQKGCPEGVYMQLIDPIFRQCRDPQEIFPVVEHVSTKICRIVTVDGHAELLVVKQLPQPRLQLAIVHLELQGSHYAHSIPETDADRIQPASGTQVT